MIEYLQQFLMKKRYPEIQPDEIQVTQVLLNKSRFELINEDI